MAISGGQQRLDWYIVPDVPTTIALVTADGSDWPSAPWVLVGPLVTTGEGVGTIDLVIPEITAVIDGADGSLALATVDDADMATILAAHPLTSRTALPWHVRLGTGEGETAVSTGALVWDLTGQRATTSLTLVVGPAGPTAVSTDPGNAAELGTDGLIFVSPTAGSAHVIRDEGAGVTDRPALDFRGVGVTVSDDPGSGATRVTIPGGGASSLDDLTDVATAGADAGEALVSDGSGWVPSAAPVVLGTDLRLTDARPPTAHSQEISTVTGLQSALDGKQPAGSYAPALGADDNYVSDAEKLALHSHSNKAALDAVSGTNTGDQTLPTWGTIAGKPAAVAAGVDAAAARTAVGAGTSSLVLGTSAGTAAAGNDARLTDARPPTAHNHAATEIISGTLAAARLPAATGTAQGAVELATTAETTTGTDTTRAVTPAGVKASLDARAADYATAAQGALAATALQPATGQAINAQTGTAYTLVAADAGKVVTLTNAAAITLTVPGNVFTTGQRVDVLVLGAGMVTAVGSSCTLNGTPSLVSRAQYSALTVLFTSATTAVVIGDLA